LSQFISLTAHSLILIFICFNGLISPVFANNADSALNRIEVQLTNGQVTQATLGEVAKIINREEGNYHAHIVMGDCCDYLGLPDQAVVQYKLAFKYAPNQPKACLSLINALDKTGQKTAAANILKQAEQKFPKDPNILLLAGNASFRQGKYAEAESSYRKALEESVHSKEPVLGLPTALAALRLRAGRYRMAYNLAKIDLAIDPNLLKSNEIAGIAAMKAAQFERALPYLKVAFNHTSAPSLTVAFDYAQSLLWCGNYNEALIPALCSLTIAGDDHDRDTAITAIKEISAHLSKRNVERAGLALRQSLVSKSAIAHSELAKICLDKGMVNRALTEAELASKYAPQSSECKYEVALILETYKHDYRKALTYLRLAHALAPNNDEISQHLMRLEDRLVVYDSDWSWQFKRWLSKFH